MDATIYWCNDELYDWCTENGVSLCVWEIELEDGMGIKEEVYYW